MHEAFHSMETEWDLHVYALSETTKRYGTISSLIGARRSQEVLMGLV